MSDPPVGDQGDNFIPFGASTPVHNKWRRPQRNQGFQRYHEFQRNSGGFQKRWSNNHNNSRNSTFESDRSNNSSGRQSFNEGINAYLHPSMLQDPWAQLRNQRNTSTNE